MSHDGSQVVYVSATSITDGRLANGPADLYSIPYANRAGGAATPLPGGSDPAATEFYPSFSPDDAFVAFTRLAGNGSSYSNPASEVYVVPFAGGAGGTAVRLAANDAAACQTTLASPGLTNDWPKWSPHATTANGKTYYWLTFSSKRMRHAQRPALRHGARRRRRRQADELPGPLPLEPARRRRQPHAVLGRLLDPADHRRLSGSRRSTEAVLGFVGRGEEAADVGAAVGQGLGARVQVEADRRDLVAQRVAAQARDGAIEHAAHAVGRQRALEHLEVRRRASALRARGRGSATGRAGRRRARASRRRTPGSPSRRRSGTTRIAPPPARAPRVSTAHQADHSGSMSARSSPYVDSAWNQA